MKGIIRDNLDLDIILTAEEINFGSKCPGREFPILAGDLTDEEGNKTGIVKLQKTATIPNNVDEQREVYFLKTDPDEWYVQLGFPAYYDLKKEGNITRRIPIIHSQLWIYNPMH